MPEDGSALRPRDEQAEAALNWVELRVAAEHALKEQKSDLALALATQALHVFEASSSQDDIDRSALLLTMADVRSSRGDHRAARRDWRGVLDIWRRILGPTHSRVALPLLGLACCLEIDHNKWKSALVLHERALKITEAQPEPSPHGLMTHLKCLARINRHLRRREADLSCSERLLEIQERELGPEHPEVASTLLGLAKVQWTLDRPADGFASIERAVAILESLYGCESLELASKLDQIAEYCFPYQREAGLGLWERMIHWYEKALALRESIVGPVHPSLVPGLRALRNHYLFRKSHQEAMDCSLRCVHILGQALRGHDPELHREIMWLAKFHAEIGRASEAELFFERALRALEDERAAWDSEAADVLYALSKMYGQQGWIEDEIVLLKQAISMWRMAYGDRPSHYDRILALERLGTMAAARGDSRAAERYMLQNIADHHALLGPRSVDTATSESRLANHYRGLGDLPSAAGMFARAIRTYELAAGTGDDNDWLLGDLQSLAEIQLDRGQFDEALVHSQRAVRLLEFRIQADDQQRESTDKPSRFHDRCLARAIEHLAKAYRATGRIFEADELQARADRIRTEADRFEARDDQRGSHPLH